jgi:nitroreductase
MNVSEALRKRRSVRGFTKQVVSESIIKDILHLAQLAPSNCNTQPWHVAVISGNARVQLEKDLVSEITAGKSVEPGFKPGDARLKGVYKSRQYQCAADYYGAVGIERSNKAARNQLLLKNWQLFGAPHVAIISMPQWMTELNALDVGIYLQSLMLLMIEYGLASCPQGALAYYPEPIFKIAEIPAGNAILCGLSFGYEDTEAQINKVPQTRVTLDDSVSFTR